MVTEQVEGEMVGLRAELTETTAYKEKLIADKTELQRSLAERETELQHARTAQKDAEQTNLRIATVVAEVKMKLAEEQAAREVSPCVSQNNPIQNYPHAPHQIIHA